MKPSKETIDNWKTIFSKRPKDALPPVYKDLEFLYDYVTEKQSKMILEFGSGCSTIVIADALQPKSFLDVLMIHSFDNELKWLIETAKIIPNNLKSYIVLHFAIVTKIKYFCYLPFDFNIIPNLIYLDGPELNPQRKLIIDPLFYEHKMSKGSAIIVDGREENVEFLKKHLLRKWKFTHKDIGDNGMSIFELEE